MKKVLFTIFLLFPICVLAIETIAILMDTDSNTILYEKNIHNKRSVASISNIMTI